MTQRATGNKRAVAQKSETAETQQADQDESSYASLTADFVLRKQAAESTAPEDQKADDPVTNIFARKGEARPLVVESRFARPSPQQEKELQRLRDELTAAQAALKEREAALAQLRLTGEQAQERWTRQAHESLHKAEQGWKAREDARFAVAEKHWQDKSSKALAETRDQADKELHRVREDLAAAQAALKERGAGEAPQESPTREAHESLQKALAEATQRCEAAEKALARWKAHTARQQKTVANAGDPAKFKDFAGSRAKSEDGAELPVRGHGTRGGAIRDVLFATSLAILAITLYPSFAPFLPERLRTNIDLVASGIQPMLGHSVPAPASVVPAAPAVAAQKTAVVIRDTQLRATPSPAAEIVSTLKSGLEAVIVQERGDWTLVRIDGEAGQGAQGWVQTSFLKAD